MALKKFFDTPIGLQIFAFLGLTGAGKSLSAVELYVVPALVLGRSVYSNTWINWSGDNLHSFTSWRDLHHVRNSLIFIDEIGDVLDPNKYKDFSDEDKNVIRYHRKRGNSIVYTAQDISDVAKQIRVKTHRFVLCEADPDGTLVTWFFKTFFNFSRVCFKTLVLTFKDLKKLTLGIGSPALDSPEESEDSDNSFSEDISDITEDLKASKEVPVPERLKFKSSTLLHNDLNASKLFYFGSWCPECCAFKKYYKDQPDAPQEAEKCPSCRNIDLTLKPLSMYDTNFELLAPNDEVIVKKYRYINKKTLVSCD